MRAATGSVDTGGPRGLDDVVREVLAEHGPALAGTVVSTGFVTRQGVRHAGRRGGYRNEVLSLRVGAAVGSCAVAPGSLDGPGRGTAGVGDVLDACAGAGVAELLAHPERAVRVAALDAYLSHIRPHSDGPAEAVEVAAGSSVQKSLVRASLVADLVAAGPGERVLVVGVVNSLLAQLRARGVSYRACDLLGGHTEWGEPVHTDAVAAMDDGAGVDAVLASGMTLGNDTWDALAAAADGRPVTVFAQTASAVFPHFLGAGLHALSAEPYPFFWLEGGASTLYRYHATPR